MEKEVYVPLFDSTQKPPREPIVSSLAKRPKTETTTEEIVDEVWTRELVPRSSLVKSTSEPSKPVGSRPKVTAEEIEELLEEHRRRRLVRDGKEKPILGETPLAETKTKPLSSLLPIEADKPIDDMRLRASSTSTTTTTRQSRFHRHVSPHRSSSRNKYNFRREFLVENDDTVNDSTTSIPRHGHDLSQTEDRPPVCAETITNQTEGGDRWKIPAAVDASSGSLQVSAVTVQTVTHSRSPSANLKTYGLLPTSTTTTPTTEQVHSQRLPTRSATPEAASPIYVHQTPPPNTFLKDMKPVIDGEASTSSLSKQLLATPQSRTSTPPKSHSIAPHSHQTSPFASISKPFEIHHSSSSATKVGVTTLNMGRTEKVFDDFSSAEEQRLSLALKAAAAQLEAMVADLKQDSLAHNSSSGQGISPQRSHFVNSFSSIAHSSPARPALLSSATSSPNGIDTSGHTNLMHTYQPVGITAVTEKKANDCHDATVKPQIANRSSSDPSVSCAPSSIAWNVEGLTSSFATNVTGTGSALPKRVDVLSGVSSSRRDAFPESATTPQNVRDISPTRRAVIEVKPSAPPPPPPGSGTHLKHFATHTNSYLHQHHAHALVAAAAEKGVHIIQPYSTPKQQITDEAVDSEARSAAYQLQQTKVQRLHQGNSTREPSPHRSASVGSLQRVASNSPYRPIISAIPQDYYGRTPSSNPITGRNNNQRSLLSRSPPRGQGVRQGPSRDVSTLSTQQKGTIDGKGGDADYHQQRQLQLLSTSPHRSASTSNQRATNFTVSSARGSSRQPAASGSYQRSRSGRSDGGGVGYMDTLTYTRGASERSTTAKHTFFHTISPAADREASVNLSIATTNTNTGRSPFTITLWDGRYQNSDKRERVVVGAGFIFLTQVTERAAKSLGCAPSPEILFTPMGHPIAKISDLRPDQHYLMLPAGCGYRADTVPVALLKRLVVAKDLLLMEGAADRNGGQAAHFEV